MTRFSKELFVSCRSFSAGRDCPEGGRALASQKTTPAISTSAPIPPAVAHGFLGCIARRMACRPARISQADV